ncbi:MAG: hypothetical protein ACXADY_24820 [Candidatus Hodarchaeales archaeon]|jgi:hypothetical protein
MLGLNIITKPGILVFSHSFTGNYPMEIDLDVDLQASITSAVLNALRETHGESVTAIRHRENMLLLYEGVLTYGILFTVDYDPELYNFLRKIVLKFELMFTDGLYKETVLNRMDFESFRKIVKEQYADMISIDVPSLDKMIKIMQQTTIANYIIYETKLLHPVFSNIGNPIISSNIQQVTQILRDIASFEKRINQEHVTSKIIFQNIQLLAIKTQKYCVILFYPTSQKEKYSYEKEIIKLQNEIAGW